jgi:type VI secretion system protein ImpH
VLASTLSHYFRVPVAIEEFVRDWIPIDPSERCRLNVICDASRLGAGASLGQAAPDAQHQFRLVIGPMPLSAYLGFSRMGQRLTHLVEWIREFVGLTFAWTVELRLDIDAAPPAALGAPLPLGWTTWLGKRRDCKFATGAMFSPELCLGLDR